MTTQQPRQQPRQQTLQQKRAAHAYDQIKGIENRPFRNKYGTVVRGLPAMIQTDGLGQALAFLMAKGKVDARNENSDPANEHHAVYAHLAAWLREKENFNFPGSLLEWLLKEPTTTYRQVAAEAQAYLGWLKRFVEARDWKSEEDNDG